MSRILITEFIDESAVARLASKAETLYLPDLADRQGDIPAMMKGIRALIVRNRTQVTADLLISGATCRLSDASVSGSTTSTFRPARLAGSR